MRTAGGRGNDDGFTLVETLVGLALLALIGLLLASALATGRRILEGFEQRGAAAATSDPLPILTELLGNARLLEVLPGQTQQEPSFVGEADRAAFVTLIEKRGQAAGLYNAVLSAQPNQNGNATALILELSLRRPGSRAVPRSEQQFVLLPDIESVSLEYLGASGAGSSTWQPRWHDAQALPQAVRVSAKPRGANGAMPFAATIRLDLAVLPPLGP